MKKIYALLFMSMAVLASGPVRAENGVTDDKIVFGQTAALDGPASALGLGMNAGILAAFHEANGNGGVNGRMLELVVREDKVFALIGGVGTPTANGVQPITSQEKVPFIGPFTGAEFLRSPFKRYVVNKLYEIGEIRLDDVTLYYGPDDNQGMDQVFMTVLQKDGTFIDVENLSE